MSTKCPLFSGNPVGRNPATEEQPKGRCFPSGHGIQCPLIQFTRKVDSGQHQKWCKSGVTRQCLNPGKRFERKPETGVHYQVDSIVDTFHLARGTWQNGNAFAIHATTAKHSGTGVVAGYGS